MKKLLTLFVITLFLGCKSELKKDIINHKKTLPKVTVNVHPGVELLTIIQKLADRFPKSTPSKYNDEVLSYFSKFKNHKAIQQLQEINKRIYPDFTELGFCFNDFPNFNLEIPNELSWYKYYDKEKVQQYLKACKEFAKESNFWQFYQNHVTDYEKWGMTVKKGLNEDQLIKKLDDFFNLNESNQPHFYICLDPLSAWGSHAIPNPEKFNLTYKGVKAYTIGFFDKNSDNSKDPRFAYGNYGTNLIWHEGSHIYIEPLFKKYEGDIEALSYLFNKDDEGMKNNNISNWEYCLNENVVRGVVISLFRKYKSNRTWKKQNAYEIVNDFIYAEFISENITKDYIEGEKYSDFAEYFPLLLKKIAKKFPKK